MLIEISIRKCHYFFYWTTLKMLFMADTCQIVLLVFWKIKNAKTIPFWKKEMFVSEIFKKTNENVWQISTLLRIYELYNFIRLQKFSTTFVHGAKYLQILCLQPRNSLFFLITRTILWTCQKNLCSQHFLRLKLSCIELVIPWAIGRHIVG